ncbi:uncharacterized protein TRIVIDRAFT_82827 [Trichoderma virens Gv29-8]|uniref:CFEM domain-containing protein n=1 Tax=Hypocrea virens (strain Gv29-8 / FGSC 10586) TaxID=413071 RepID=G9N7K7_HYPVG|nr:uncharacterized protein TRIVIDRAFT_82827 [Trichoderma virens Gv29-8]EHK16973.1 hypothetical protein TRIVIDRAFT_82827 [Trichoderma virens Gv29-8]UKZ55386.1 hypothetical protein TrVGV298_009209 [Trichoderma virens]UKZ81154.1 hypothetical protein TrVFT333_008925 [Trichoderma virens FT-333]
MKASVITLLLAGLVAAQDFTGQPDCAIPCLKDAIPKAGCALTDTACACKADVQAKLAGLVAPCLISKCSASDLAKAQSAAAEACKKDTSGSSSAASSHASTTAPSSETSAASTTDSTTEAGKTTTGPASTAATETTASETSAPASSAPTSAGHTIPTSAPGGISNSTTSGVRSVVTRTSTAFVGGDEGSSTSAAPASTTLAGNDASAPVAGVLGAVLAALMAL